ncbi:glutathione s-transferase [Trichoderma arundinaceum]|uniref:glutathione transferase n=1 Tax=Trichoderma arundinaceum TaxID=490622 RepID=A0A395NJ78_TRIAR|nr:glutathione s-transferase [Trichoderma arundinaceum]
MSQITLFTDSRLPCPQRLLLTIHELELQIKNIREVDISKLEHKNPDILELNPFGAVPFIRDDAYDPPLMLAESRAIARYLVRAYGSGDIPASLLPDPSNIVAIAKFEEAASIELTSFDAVANQLVFEELFKPLWFHGTTDIEKCKVLRERLEQVIELLDKRLASQRYMAGDKLTVADLFFVPYMHHLDKTVYPTLLKMRPHMRAWWKRMTNRESYQVLFGDLQIN